MSNSSLFVLPLIGAPSLFVPYRLPGHRNECAKVKQCVSLDVPPYLRQCCTHFRPKMYLWTFMVLNSFALYSLFYYIWVVAKKWLFFKQPLYDILSFYALSARLFDNLSKVLLEFKFVYEPNKCLSVGRAVGRLVGQLVILSVIISLKGSFNSMLLYLSKCFTFLPTGYSLNIVFFFSRILQNLLPLPQQHSAAICCTKNSQPIRVTVHSHCIESFEGLIQRCKRRRGAINCEKTHFFLNNLYV